MFHLRDFLCPNSYLVYKIRAKTLVALKLKRISLLQLQICYCLQGFKFSRFIRKPLCRRRHPPLCFCLIKLPNGR